MNAEEIALALACNDAKGKSKGGLPHCGCGSRNGDNWLTHCPSHDDSHSHASLMLKQGIHPKIVQERLGHTTISVTLDIYSHVAPGLQEAAAQRFDEMLGNKDKLTVH
jgi:integrase